MHFTYDPSKQESNRHKHGVPLSFATKLDWDNALHWIDGRFGYDELRMTALVPYQNKLFYVAYVDRAMFMGDTLRRIISLRRATRQETLKYVKDF